MSFEVATGALRTAGRRMRSAGQQLAEQKPHAAVADLAAALRGTASAVTAQALSSVWQRRFSRLATATEVHGQVLVADAERYDLSDDRVDRALSGPPAGPQGDNLPVGP